MSKLLPMSAVSPSPTSPQVLAENIASGGAIMTLAGSPVQHHLIGQLVWLEPNKLFWFTAHGDSPQDGHLLVFEDSCAVANRWICFFHSGRLVGCLSAIRAAGVADPDDYLIAWQLWQEVAPMRAKLIRNCVAQFEESEDGSEVPFRLRSPRIAAARKTPDACRHV